MSQSTSQTNITTSAQETFRNIFSFILPAVGSETRRIATVTNSSAMGYTSYETYSRHLSLMGHGYPLWIPEPNEHLHINYRKQGVTIGDVVIFTDNGALDFVFNICYAADDPINSNGVPEGFLPFSPELTSWDTRRYQQYGEGSYLASKSISKKTDPLGPSGLVFLSSASEGAILTMPKGAYSEDLARVTGFDGYLAANLESWYEYVNEVRGWGVEMGKLHLVTGAHKSKAWGIATFSNGSDAEMAEVRLRFKSMDDPLYGTLYSWDYEGESDCPRAGPTREQKQSLYEGLSQEEPGSFENQCLFVRTVNAAMRVSKEIKTSQANAIASQNQANGPSELSLALGLRGYGSHESNPALSILQSTTRSAYGNRPGGFLRHPQLPTVRNGPLPVEHPSEAINAFLLKKTIGARIAITHDHHWMSLLTEKDLEFPTKEELLNRLTTSYKITENDGIISLESMESPSSESQPQVRRHSPQIQLPSGYSDSSTSMRREQDSLKHPRYIDSTPLVSPSTSMVPLRPNFPWNSTQYGELVLPNPEIPTAVQNIYRTPPDLGVGTNSSGSNRGVVLSSSGPEEESLLGARNAGDGSSTVGDLGGTQRHNPGPSPSPTPRRDYIPRTVRSRGYQSENRYTSERARDSSRPVPRTTYSSGGRDQAESPLGGFKFSRPGL